MRHAILSLCALLPLAAETAPPVTLLASPGRLLVEESFADAGWAKRWKSSKGEYQVVAGALRAAEREADMHHPAAGWQGPVRDVVLRFRFRLDGSPWLGISFSDKEHVARLFVRSNKVEIAKMSGIGPTTKKVTLAQRAMTFDPQKWYTATIELCGDDLLARIDDGEPLYGHHAGMDVPKARVVLISGKQYAWFDDVVLWEATRHPQWENNKAKLVK